MTRRAAIFLTLLISLMAGISNGNVLGFFEDRVVTNAYDRVYRLVTETAAETGGSTVTTSYDHDKANNRTEKIVTGGSNPGTWSFAHGSTADGYNSNQVKSVTKGATVTTFVYDLNGNRTEKKVGGTTVQTYGFDRENRLTSLADSAKGTFSYSYDHRTRRVDRDETGASGTEDEVSFAGGLSVQEYIGGSGTPTVEYVRGSDYGGGIGGVLYTIRGGSARSYNAYNSRGDVVSKTDQAGVITWQSSYEAFGTRTQEQGSTDDRQKANTKDEDPTGLLNEGMRYRDLEFGIFLTRDPAGFVDGPNVYTYVRQNPWTRFDPLGLAEKDLAVNDAMEDGKLEYNEATRLKWDEGQAEGFLEKQNPGKLATDAETRESIVTTDIFGNEQIHSNYAKARKAWEDGASIDDAVAGETARRNRTRATHELWNAAGDPDDKKRIQVMQALYEVGSLSTLPLQMVNPTAASRAMATGGGRAATKSVSSFTPASQAPDTVPELYGPFYHYTGAGNQISESGVLLGRAMKDGSGGGAFPRVKAYLENIHGPQPGVKFMTPVRPTSGGGQASWPVGLSGVHQRGDFAGIPVRVIGSTEN